MLSGHQMEVVLFLAYILYVTRQAPFKIGPQTKAEILNYHSYEEDFLFEGKT